MAILRSIIVACSRALGLRRRSRPVRMIQFLPNALK